MYDITWFQDNKTYRIFIGKGTVSDYWIVCIFGIVSVWDCNMAIGE